MRWRTRSRSGQRTRVAAIGSDSDCRLQMWNRTTVRTLGRITLRLHVSCCEVGTMRSRLRAGGWSRMYIESACSRKTKTQIDLLLLFQVKNMATTQWKLCIQISRVSLEYRLQAITLRYKTIILSTVNQHEDNLLKSKRITTKCIRLTCPN